MNKKAVSKLVRLIVVLAWLYILIGILFGVISSDHQHWFFLSSSIAGASVLLVHLVELPWGLKKAAIKSKSSLYGIINTLIFGVTWWVFDPDSKSS